MKKTVPKDMTQTSPIEKSSNENTMPVCPQISTLKVCPETAQKDTSSISENINPEFFTQNKTTYNIQTEPVSPAPDLDQMAALFQNLDSTKPSQHSQLVNVEVLMDSILQQLVKPHMTAVNECENRLRSILFEKIYLPIIRHVVERELSLYEYCPTFMQLNDIVRLACRESGLFPR